MIISALLKKSYYCDVDKLPPHEVEVEIDDEKIKKIVAIRLEKIGIQLVECKACGQPICFLPTKGGKQMPVNLSLTSHFADCPKANQFRKK